METSTGPESGLPNGRDHFTVADAEVQSALALAEDGDAAPEERAEMLMEIARGLQIKPRSPRQLPDSSSAWRISGSAGWPGGSSRRSCRSRPVNSAAGQPCKRSKAGFTSMMR